jgi:hypothetical protein
MQRSVGRRALEVPSECTVERRTFGRVRDNRPFPRHHENPAMTEEKAAPPLPDHLSVDPKSPHHVAAVFEHDIGIRFNDKERSDVEE